MSSDHEPDISLRDAGGRRERDFIALFNALWYRDFPYSKGRRLSTVRAMYTAHLNGIIKACADLMGFFVSYEHGIRTDLIIETACEGRRWAHVEIEWKQAFRESVNEISKLADEAQKADLSIFVGYSDVRQIDNCLRRIAEQWPHPRHLLVFMLTYKTVKKGRALQTLVTYRVRSHTPRKLREQFALPWHVPDTRWQASARSPESEVVLVDS